MFQDLKPYPEYKDADLPWLETLPSHWTAARGKTLFTRMERQVREEDGVVTCFRDGRVMLRSRRRTTGFTESLKEIGYQGIRQGDLVIHAMDAFAGAVGVAEDDGKSTPVYAVCVPRGDASTRYYAHLVRRLALSGWIQANARGVRERSTDYRWASFAEERLPVPPGEEQRAIVTYLAHAHQRINKAIATKRELIKLLDEARRSVVSEVLTRGLDPQAPMKDSGIPGLGDIPAHWMVRRAKDLCSSIVDCKNRTTPYVADGEYTVVRTTCIRGGRFSLEGSYPTDRAGYEEWTERGAPQAGDVFFTREAPSGEAALVPEAPGLCMGQRMMYFRPYPSEMHPEFLLHAIYGPVTRQAIAVATNGSTVGHLRLGEVSALPIIWCPIEEQVEVLKHLAHATARYDRERTVLDREIGLLEEFKARLTADVVTGQVDVRSIAATLPPIDFSDVFAASAGADDANDVETADEAGMEDE